MDRPDFMDCFVSEPARRIPHPIVTGGGSIILNATFPAHVCAFNPEERPFDADTAIQMQLLPPCWIKCTLKAFLSRNLAQFE